MLPLGIIKLLLVSLFSVLSGSAGLGLHGRREHTQHFSLRYKVLIQQTSTEGQAHCGYKASKAVSFLSRIVNGRAPASRPRWAHPWLKRAPHRQSTISAVY